MYRRYQVLTSLTDQGIQSQGTDPKGYNGEQATASPLELSFMHDPMIPVLLEW